MQRNSPRGSTRRATSVTSGWHVSFLRLAIFACVYSARKLNTWFESLFYVVFYWMSLPFYHQWSVFKFFLLFLAFMCLSWFPIWCPPRWRIVKMANFNVWECRECLTESSCEILTWYLCIRIIICKVNDRWLRVNKCKKLQFIHTVNGDGLKIAKKS